jgi:hypothetical protein
MKISDLLSQYPDIRNIEDPNANNYSQVVTQALRHSSRSDMLELYNIARPNEENIFKQWRIDNRRHFTIAPIFRFKLMLIRVLQASLENIDDKNYPGLSKFVYDELTDLSIVDPNAKIVEWPYLESNPEIPPSTPVEITGVGQNSPIAVKSNIIPSEHIKVYHEDYFVWRTGEKINLGTEKSPELVETFKACDKQYFYILTPKKVDKKIEYTPEVWYFHELKRLPVADLPGFKLLSGYKESICFPAFPLLDEAVIAISSDQVTRIRHSQPKLVVNADLTCPTCNGAGTEIFKDEKIRCKTCHGGAVLKDVGDFSTVRIKGIRGEFDRTNTNPIYYVAQPSGIEYTMAVWEKLIDKAETALCTDLLEGSGNESGIAKELRMEPKQDLLKMYGEQFCEMIENIINNRAQLLDIKAKEIVISPPIYYQTKSPEMIRSELIDSLPGERYVKYLELIKAKHRGNDLMIKIHLTALLYAPLLIYKQDEVDSVIQLGSYSEKDIKRRDYSVYVFTEIFKQAANDKKSKKELFQMADDMLIEMGVMVADMEGPLALDEITSVDQLPDDLDELEEVLTKLLNEEISREDALRLVVIIEGVSEQEAEQLLIDTGL